MHRTHPNSPECTMHNSPFNGAYTLPLCKFEHSSWISWWIARNWSKSSCNKHLKNPEPARSSWPKMISFTFSALDFLKFNWCSQYRKDINGVEFFCAIVLFLYLTVEKWNYCVVKFSLSMLKQMKFRLHAFKSKTRLNSARVHSLYIFKCSFDCISIHKRQASSYMLYTVYRQIRSQVYICVVVGDSRSRVSVDLFIY